MDIDSFQEELLKIGIKLTSRQLEQFEIYYHELIIWNEKMNLTAITKKEEVYEKHFYDCLLASQIIDFNNQNICDVGAGAGFPSIPLKIVFPNLKVTIVDSLNKRITFLNHLSDKLGLENFNAISARAEEYALDNEEKYDIVMARAVARLNILLELCVKMVKVSGYFIALKGKAALDEISESKIALEKLDLKIEKKEKYQLISEKDTRYLLLIKKLKKTNSKFPRSFGQIKKKPL